MKEALRRTPGGRRARLIGVATGIVMAVGLFAAPAIAAPAPTSTVHTVKSETISVVTAFPQLSTSGYVNIRNKKAVGNCIGIDTSGYAGSWSCTPNLDQQWEMNPNVYVSGAVANPANQDQIWVGDFYQIVNAQDQCLGVQNGSTIEGARIRGGGCNDADNQRWATVTTPAGGDTFYLVNLSSGYVIGVSGSATNSGAQLVQWAANTNGDQYWY